MSIIGGLDVHRAQITYDWIDTDTGQPGAPAGWAGAVRRPAGRVRLEARQDRPGDARHLRDLLMGGLLPESWIPPAHVLEARTQVRLYKALSTSAPLATAHPCGLFRHGVPAESDLLVAERCQRLTQGAGLTVAAHWSESSERLQLAARQKLGAARVNLPEALSYGNHCVVAVSSFGWVIHTAVGSVGGVGGLRTKRSGCSA